MAAASVFVGAGKDSDCSEPQAGSVFTSSRISLPVPAPHAPHSALPEVRCCGTCHLLLQAGASRSPVTNWLLRWLVCDTAFLGPHAADYMGPAIADALPLHCTRSVSQVVGLLAVTRFCVVSVVRALSPYGYL